MTISREGLGAFARLSAYLRCAPGPLGQGGMWSGKTRNTVM